MFLSELVKALQWVKLKGFRDELDRTHAPGLAADQADLDDALAGANFLRSAKNAYHPLFAQEPLRRPSDPAKRRWTR